MKRYKDLTKEELIKTIINSDYFKRFKYNIDITTCCNWIKTIPNHKITGKILGVTRRNRLCDIIQNYVEENKINIYESQYHLFE